MGRIQGYVQYRGTVQGSRVFIQGYSATEEQSRFHVCLFKGIPGVRQTTSHSLTVAARGFVIEVQFPDLFGDLVCRGRRRGLVEVHPGWQLLEGGGEEWR